MQKIKLKRTDEIDFNKYSGSYHLGFEIAKNKLGRKVYQIYQQYSFYGAMKIHIEDRQGNVIKTLSGEVECFPLSYFKKTKSSKPSKKTK